MRIQYAIVFKATDGHETEVSGAMDMPGVQNAGDARDRVVSAVRASAPALRNATVVDSFVGKA